MRALFLLLVLANLVFFAYAQVALEDAGRGDRLPQLQVAPERIKLLKSAAKAPPDRPRAPGKGIPPALPRAASSAPAACMEWGIFAGPGVARAEAALARLELAPERIERTVTDSGGYWVHMPPQKNRADADRKVGELKALGVTEFFLVQEPAKWRNAISLGIFRTDEAAQAFLARLKERGVRTAVMARRENFLKQVVFHVREPGEATVARLTMIQQEFPGSELKAGPCPNKG
ncbi:MAG: SPOR domain-containing protein [Betaproteobacteria bacterium]|nr:SPOR domain-containing protein [Betaproteobacteria bacterium]